MLKRFNFIFFGIILILPNILFAQENIFKLMKDTAKAYELIKKANTFKEKGLYDSSLVCFDKASQIFYKNKIYPGYLDAKNSASSIYRYKGKNHGSIETIENAIDSTKGVIKPNHILYANAYNNLALATKNIGNYEEAINYLKKSIGILEFHHHYNWLPFAYHNLTDLYINLEQYDSAMTSIHKTITFLETNKSNQIQLLKVYNKAAYLYEVKGLYGKALNIIDKALTLAEISNNKLNFIELYNKKGKLFLASAEYDKALEYLLKAEKISAPIKDNALKADIAINIGLSYYKKSQHDLSINYLNKALNILDKSPGNNSALLAKTHNCLSLNYHQKGEYKQAIVQQEKALEFQKEIYGDGHKNLAVSYNNMGLIFNKTGNIGQALEYYKKAYNILHRIFGDYHPDIAKYYTNISAIYQKIGDTAQVLANLEKALEIKEKVHGKPHPIVAKAYNNLALTHHNCANYKQALQFFNKALECNTKSLNQNDTIREERLNIDLIFNKMVYFNSLMQKAKTLEFLYTSPKDSLFLLNALRNYEKADTLAKVLKKGLQLKSDKITFASKASRLYLNAINVCYILSKIKEYPVYIEKALYFSEQNKATILLEALAEIDAKQFSGIPDSLLQYERELSANIADLQKELAKKPHDTVERGIRTSLVNLNNEYNQLVLNYEKQYPSYYNLKHNDKRISISKINAKIPKKTLVLSYNITDDYIFLFSIINNEPPKFLRLEKPVDFDEHLMLFRDFLANPYNASSTIVYNKIAHIFYKQLIPPIGPKIKTLVIIPDGNLCKIPFEAFLLEKIDEQVNFTGYPFLLKKYDISYIFSLRLIDELNIFQEKTTTGDQKSFYGIAPVFSRDIDTAITLYSKNTDNIFATSLANDKLLRSYTVSHDRLQTLPGTKAEVTQIYNIFKSTGESAIAQLYNAANETNIKSGVLENINFLHFATHGVVNEENPELSGLFLSKTTDSIQDGFLYSGEVYNLRINADLTVLSACETGLGKLSKGEGIIGLSRAFLFAGSRNVMVSLWPVADNSTKNLMVDFYDGFMNNRNKSFSSILKEAKLNLIKDEKYANPFYWSPFILIGY